MMRFDCSDDPTAAVYEAWVLFAVGRQLRVTIAGSAVDSITNPPTDYVPAMWLERWRPIVGYDVCGFFFAFYSHLLSFYLVNLES